MRIAGCIYNTHVHIQSNNEFYKFAPEVWLWERQRYGLNDEVITDVRIYTKDVGQSDPVWAWTRYNWLLFTIPVLLPIITGLGLFCYLARPNRFSSKSPVHLWSRWQVLLCAIFLYDTWIFDWPSSASYFSLNSTEYENWYTGAQPRVYNDDGKPIDDETRSRLYVHLEHLRETLLQEDDWRTGAPYAVRDLISDALTVLQLVIQTYVINVKLKVLGWHRIPRCCMVLGCIASLYASFAAVNQYVGFEHSAYINECYSSLSKAKKIVDAGNPWAPPEFHFHLPHFNFLPRFDCLVMTWHMMAFLPVVLLQALCLWHTALKSCTWENRWTVCCLGLNGLLALLGTVTSSICSVLSHPSALLTSLQYLHRDFALSRDPSADANIVLLMGQVWTTIDLSIQVFNSLLLSGMIGPREWANQLETFQQLAEDLGFSLGQNKRIAFPGKINESSHRCLAI